MANSCPKCGNQVDTQANFDCSKCGEQFWQNKESFFKREVKKSFKHAATPKVKLPISFWWRLIISIRFREYFLKGFVSGFITVIVFLVTLVALASPKNSNALSYILIVGFYLLQAYWLAITIGYIYGFIKFRKLAREIVLKTKSERAKRDGGKLCSQCGKKVDGDSVFCIYCGVKLATSHQPEV